LLKAANHLFMNDSTATGLSRSMSESSRARFTRSLTAHRGIVRKVARAWSADEEERLDLEQEILMQVWRAWHAYDPARSFSTWMYRIALNVALSWQRRSAWKQAFHDEWDDERLAGVPASDDDAQDDDHETLLRQVMARLPPMDRALLLLYLEDRSQREMAEVLGISDSNVSTRLNRLRQRLRAEHGPAA